MRAGAGFWVTLEAERRRVGARNALQRAIEQRDVGACAGWRARSTVDRKTVVLAGDRYPPAVEVLHRMIGAVMAELHLDGLAPEASASNWWPRQMPNVGTPAATNSLIARIA